MRFIETEAPSITVNWGAGAQQVLDAVSAAVTQGWPYGAAVIGLFVAYRLINRFVRGS